MARHLVRLDLDDVRRDDVVYFSVLQRFVAIYPMSWVMPLMGIAVLAYLAVAGAGPGEGAGPARGGRRRVRDVPGRRARRGVAVGLSGSPWASAGPSGIVMNRPDLGMATACWSRGTTSRS